MATYHVTIAGSDAAAGSQVDPWGTLAHALATAAAGDLIQLDAGSVPANRPVTLLIHADGTATAYVAGSDAERGTALLAILVAAVNAEVIRFMAATYAGGASVFQSSAALFYDGAGRYVTRLTSSANLTASGVIFSPGNKSIVQGVGAECVGDGATTTNGSVFGFRNTGNTNTPPVDVTAIDCDFAGNADAIYVAYAAATTARWRFINCTGAAKWDGAYFLTSGTIVDLVDCSLIARGPCQNVGNQDCSGLRVAGGAWANIYRSRLEAHDGEAATRALVIEPGSKATLINCDLASSNAAGTAIDISFWTFDGIPGAESDCVLIDSRFDANKITYVNGGAVRVIEFPGLLTRGGRRVV